MAIIMDIKEITSMEISIIGVTIGHSKLDRETQPPTSNFEKFLGKGGRIFCHCFASQKFVYCLYFGYFHETSYS
jgi:hypothetical protein